MDQYSFFSRPQAKAEAVVSGPNYRFTLLGEYVIRCEWSADGQFEDRASTFAIDRSLPVPGYQVHDSSEQLEITTSGLRLVYDKKRFSTHGLNATFSSKSTLWGAQWRFGIQTDSNLGGTARTLDAVNGRCDVGQGILSRAGYAFLDDSHSMLFDGCGWVAPRAEGDRVDGYLFYYGDKFKEAMKAFYAISGKQPRLPRWTLGNWWSRYYAYTSTEYIDLMDKFKVNNIPLSVAVIDMDWHRVTGEDIKSSGWTGYTWNKDLIPDPDSFTRALHDRKLKVTLNDHPHSGVQAHEDQYNAIAKVLDFDTADQRPILFDATCPKFMHATLNVLHRKLEKDGVDFWWLDWQQGSYSNKPGVDPLWVLNHFHFLDNQKQVGDDALIFSRYGGPGSHRYPVGFSGDSITSWETLAFQPEFTATASNIGYGWWSHDIGGHMLGGRDNELFVRWIQFACFSPILRLHSSNSRWQSKEPWLFNPESCSTIQHFMRLRHRLVPYIYTTNVIGADEDETLIQPMYWKYPSQDAAFEVPNQYHFGPSLVVAPIVQPRDPKTGLASVKVWIPPHRHVDIFTGVVYDGNRNIVMYRSINSFPVLAREGSIIPLDASGAPANGCRNPEALDIYIVVGQDANYTIIEDMRDDLKENKGETKMRQISVGFNQENGQVQVKPRGKAITLRFLGIIEIPSNMYVFTDGIITTDFEASLAADFGAQCLTVSLPKTHDDEATVVVEIGRDPQLSFIDTASRIETLLMSFEILYELKDKIWSVVSNSGLSLAVKFAELMSMNIDQTILGPVLEFLFADSRQTYYGHFECD